MKSSNIVSMFGRIIIKALFISIFFTPSCIAQVILTIDHKQDIRVPLSLLKFDQNGLMYEDIGKQISDSKRELYRFESITPVTFKLNSMKFTVSSQDSLHISFDAQKKKI